jgi:hypothetical protein
MKHDRIKSDRMKNDRIKSDRIKSITDPNQILGPLWRGVSEKYTFLNMFSCGYKLMLISKTASFLW